MLSHILEDSHYRFIMIDAENLSHRHYLSTIIGDNDCNYLCFSEHNTDLDTIKAELCGEYERLKAESHVSNILILDECDRLADDSQNDLFHFLESTAIPKIILFSRHLLPAIHDDPLLSSLAYVIPNDNDDNTLGSEKHRIRAFGFGVGQIWLNGCLIDFSKSPLLHEFFFYILEQESIFRADAIAEFWSGFSKKLAVNNFHVTRSKLHDLLGIEFLSYVDPHYQINPDIIIHYDVDNYRQQIAPPSIKEVQSPKVMYQNAYNKYQGDFLSGHHSLWVRDCRNLLRSQHSDSCFNLAQSIDSIDEALGYYAQAFHFNPYREDTIAEIMKIYMQQNRADEAINAFEALVNNLNDYKIEPNNHLKKLYNQAKANLKTWQKAYSS